MYSLGVLLYELLTDTTPFEQARFSSASLDDLRHIICHEEPPRPSARISTLSARQDTTQRVRRDGDDRDLRNLLRGELDWIVLKALEKDRTRRYESASALARDVERFLNHEAVEAFPPSRLYRFRKFARRNRVVLASTRSCSSHSSSASASRPGSRCGRSARRTTRKRRGPSPSNWPRWGWKCSTRSTSTCWATAWRGSPKYPPSSGNCCRPGLDYYEQFVAHTQNRSDSDLVIGNAQRQVGLIYGRLGDRQKEADAYLKAIHVYEQRRASRHNAAVEFRLASCSDRYSRTRRRWGNQRSAGMRRSGDRDPRASAGG